uniref:Chromatin accessibility complex protein 1 n=1 Tax=Laticauda laticaudata TaxID=8630 RepID=A0A8C5WNF4_LATLA
MASRWSGASGGGEDRLVSLPLSRIRVIMKSSPEVSSINPDAIFLTAKATELFVQYLATYAYRHGQGNKHRNLTYTHLSQAVQNSDTFQFLADIVPKKILANKYLKMLQKEKEGKEIKEEEETEESEAEEAS